MFRTLRYNFIMLVYIIILFQEFLQSVIPAFKYFDEALAVYLLFYYITKPQSKRLEYKTRNYRLTLLIFSLTTIGVLSNLISDISRTPFAIVYDIFCVNKILIFYFGGYSLFFSINDEIKQEMLKRLASITRIIVLLSFIGMIINLILPGGFARIPGEFRYGIRSYGALFSGPAFLNMYVYDYIFILTADLKNSNPGKNRYGKFMYIIMSIFLWLSTLRSRAFAYALVYVGLLIIYLFLQKRKKTYRLKIRYLVIGAIASLAVSYNMILEYFIQNSRQARYKLIRIAVQMVKDYFPLGAGFGTFGTNAAIIQYSPVYEKYGVSNDWGLSKAEPGLLFDSFWPSVFGQFGIIGAIVMACIIYYVFRNIIHLCSDNKYYFVASVMLTICIVGSTLATCSIYSYESCGLILIAMLIVARNNKIGKEM